MIKKETAGGTDENVFDIRPGVAIGIFIKNGGGKKEVFYSDCWGLREMKYDWLGANDIYSTKWGKIEPKSPQYFFIKRDDKGSAGYEKLWKISDIFPANSVGIITARDNLAIRWSEEDMWNTVVKFSSMDPELARAGFDLGKDAQDWKIEWAQRDLKESGPDKKFIAPILYRPFDARWTYYTGRSRGFIVRVRQEVMQHMLKPNLALSLTKRHSGSNSYNDVFVSNQLTEGHLLSGALGITYTFPLYFYYNEPRQQTVFGGQKKLDLPGTQHTLSAAEDKKPNISPILMQKLEAAYKSKPSPEEIFFYIYAILYAPTYRKKYAEFLKTDFPRIPFTSDYKLFKTLVTLGAELVELHLLKSSKLDSPIAKFLGGGDGRVTKPEYKKERAYINEAQYFDGVAPEIWNYFIGGYQVLSKWLKDRKGRILSSEDIKHYCKIITAIKLTTKFQEFIDEAYSGVEKNLIE